MTGCYFFSAALTKQMKDESSTGQKAVQREYIKTEGFPTEEVHKHDAC